MASHKQLFAKLNISIKNHFCFLHGFSHFCCHFAYLLLTHTCIFSLSYYFKVLKRIVHKNSLYIYWMSHLHFPWVGYGEGSGISGRLFIGFRMGVRGTTFRFCYCATFHVSGSCSNPTQERDLNVCIMCMYNVYCMYNFNLINT